ncbi:Cytochrome P450 CYP4 [Frankliniella occidentalis]|uniref:Cytochrome P450 4C1-like n=1 Tax=Frankliniella occidentalis TaxID=133901 RepID=A0A9C6TN72_FRAOC|nr:cytochrome P450 4C1-like [Frankliniella occidentalis]KAE8751143.1 Cytochrome P450 CYP4 [Frankliniella occidentalis]
MPCWAPSWGHVAVVAAALLTARLAGGARWCALAAAALLLLLLLLLVARVLLWVARRAARAAHQHALTRDIPGPRLEHFLRLWRARRSPARVSDLFHDVAREHRDGGIFKFWSGPVLFVILMRADDIECLLTDRRAATKSLVYDLIGTLMGEGLLHLSGERWRRRRRIVQPYFSPEVLRGFPEVFHRRAEVLVRLLAPSARSGQAVNVLPFAGQAVTDMVCHTVMASDVDTRAMEEEGIANAMSSGLAIILYRVFNPWFLHDGLFKLSRLHAHFKRSMELFDAFTLRLLSIKRGERQAQPRGPADGGAQRKATFLDVMLDTEAALTDGEVLDEVKGLITAATGGSTDALCFVLLCISLRQDVQDRIVQEITSVFGEDVDRAGTMDDMRHLEYLERVIKETLRMFPSIPQFGRSPSQDIELPSGHKVPAGAQVFVYSPAVHMDPAHFPEPEQFEPDRFLASAGRHPFAYLPFGAGAHTCIGQRYALLQIKSTVSVLLRHYRLLPAGTPRSPAALHDIRTNVLVTQRARGGYWMRLEPRRPPPADPATG